MMYKGHEMACKKNAPVSFKYDGIETTLYPDQLSVDDNMIAIRFKEILKEKNRISNVSHIINNRLTCVNEIKFFLLVFSP